MKKDDGAALGAMLTRRQGKSMAAAYARDFALALGQTVKVASPAADGGVHICTVHPFPARRR